MYYVPYRQTPTILFVVVITTLSSVLKFHDYFTVTQIIYNKEVIRITFLYKGRVSKSITSEDTAGDVDGGTLTNRRPNIFFLPLFFLVFKQYERDL